jgi:D-alanyl-D-alanine carboxypeptidase (penicillin-binding protein 5/6)
VLPSLVANSTYLTISKVLTGKAIRYKIYVTGNYKQNFKLYMRATFRFSPFYLTYIFVLFILSPFIARAESSPTKIASSNEGGTIEDNSFERYPGTTELSMKSKQAIIMDYATSKILLEKNAKEQMIPSSMTKMLTSYLIEDKISKKEASFDSSYIVSEKAWRMGGTKSFMPLGEMVRLEDILRGIIIQSGNDACIVAAEGLYGSEENFADAMNLKAQELGMKDTHFVNSSGWPAENHYSTAYDLALLGIALIRDHQEFYHIYSEKVFTFGKDRKGAPITQGNRNPLLYKDVNCDGIKTGATDKGGYGMVASCVDNGRRYVIVINGLNSMQERSNEALTLLSWVKQNFINKRFYSKGEVIAEVPVWLGVKDKVRLLIAEDASILIPRSRQNNIELKKELPLSISAPLKAGDVVGKVLITNGNDVYEVALITEEHIEKVGIFKQAARYISYLLGNK